MTKEEKFWMVFLLGLILLGMLTSCRTIKYVPVPEYHQIVVEKHDTLVARDSIYERDSIYVVKNGDTITMYRDRILYRDRWRDKVVYRDSLRVDSIRVPYPVYVEKKKSFIDKAVTYVGDFSLFAILLIAGFYVYKYVRRRGI